MTDDELRSGWDAGTLTPEQTVDALVRLFGFNRAAAEQAVWASKPEQEGDTEHIA